MAERNFMELLSAQWDEGKFVCVGLDSDASKLPLSLRVQAGVDPADHQLIFNDAIVDATKDIVCAYKPNLAFYRGGNGKYALRDTIYHINAKAPDVPVILDVKQGDIGNTNDGHAAEDFDWYGADAVTVSPYTGMEAMRPFLDQKNKGIIVLCRTSNPGAGEFQNLVCAVYDGDHEVYAEPEDVAAFPAVLKVGTIQKMPLYKVVAHRIANHWNYNGNCCLVVGATYPDEMSEIRALVPDIPFLIPGIGSQGGDLEATVRAGATANGRGMIINNGSKIIFASEDDDFAKAARRETTKMHNDIMAVLAAREE